MRARALVLPALACAAALGACDSGGDGSDPTTTAGGGPDGSSAPLYFTAGEQLRESPGPGSSPEATARALVAGPPANDEAGLDSEIPARTRVEGVRVSGGTATVRLSGGFTGGIPADPGRRTDDQQAAIDARLAQVTYTMTGLDGVERTRVLAGGRPLGPARSRIDFAKPRGGPPARAQRPQQPAERRHPRGPEAAGGAPLPAAGGGRRDRRDPDATGGDGVPGLGGPRAGRDRRAADEGGARRGHGARSRAATGPPGGSRSTGTRA